MSIYDLVDSILSRLNKPFYYGMPDLDKVPSTFLTYDDYEVPLLAGDDTLLATKFNITINVISDKLDEVLNKQIKTTMMDNGFTFISGGLLSLGDDLFPLKKRYVLEFQIDKEE